MKLYKKTSVNLFYTSEVSNGLYLSGNLEFAGRDPLRNTTDLLITDDPYKLFTSNDPLYSKTDDSLFTSNNSLSLDITLRIRFKQKYYTMPHRKVISGSKYPRVNIGFKIAAPLTKTMADYSMVRLTVNDAVKLGLFGTFNYRAQGGYFLHTNRLYFMDYKHFNGNLTVIANADYLGSFKLLEYYKYSTKQWFGEVHAEHHFNGFIFNKIPLLKKATFQEVVGGHVLFNDKLDQYYEINFGIEKILQVLRIDYVLGYGPYGDFNQGFMVGLGVDF
jgi:hypothetical protein